LEDEQAFIVVAWGLAVEIELHILTLLDRLKTLNSFNFHQALNPITIIRTTGDPGNPYEWATRLRKLFTNSPLIALTGQSHVNQSKESPLSKILTSSPKPRRPYSLFDVRHLQGKIGQNPSMNSSLFSNITPVEDN
jgi:hypothetical protein